MSQKKPKRKPKKKVKVETFCEIIDDDDDENREANLPELPSFTAKEDPEFIIPDEQLSAVVPKTEPSKYPKR